MEGEKCKITPKRSTCPNRPLGYWLFIRIPSLIPQSIIAQSSRKIIRKSIFFSEVELE
jgi:hypothetical protein